MRIAKLEPFNKVWVDCDTNRTLSLLMSVDQKYEVLAYANDYEYYTGISKIDGYSFEYIANQKRKIMQQRYCIREKVYADISDEEFLAETKENLRAGKCVIAAADLFYLVEGNVCYKKLHWAHYTLITEYCEESDLFKIFDDRNSEYVSYNISKEDLLLAIHSCNLFPKAYVICLKDKFDFDNISSFDLAENAYSTIRSIQTGKRRNFWKLRDVDYIEKTYMDLEALFIKEIECRQICSRKLMDYLKKQLGRSEEPILDKLAGKFLYLESQWKKIRQLLYRLYISEDHDKYLIKINEKTQHCLEEEETVWYEFARYLLSEIDPIIIKLQ